MREGTDETARVERLRNWIYWSHTSETGVKIETFLHGRIAAISSEMVRRSWSFGIGPFNGGYGFEDPVGSGHAEAEDGFKGWSKFILLPGNRALSLMVGSHVDPRGTAS